MACLLASRQGLPLRSSGRFRWGDYDNDGDLDLFLIGVTEGPAYEKVTRLYRNNNGSFVISEQAIETSRQMQMQLGQTTTMTVILIFYWLAT